MNSVLLDGQAITPNKVVCVGRNYAAHIKELGNAVPEEMVIFFKPNSAISNQLYAIKGEPLHYECELCFIAKAGKFVGVGLGLDLTKRGLQSKLKAQGLPWERAKSFDGAAVFSEFVSFSDADVESLRFELWVNNELRQEGDPRLMLNTSQQIQEYLSSFTSLQDGDVVMTGTPAGVGVIAPGDYFQARLYQTGELKLESTWRAL